MMRIIYCILLCIVIIPGAGKLHGQAPLRDAEAPEPSHPAARTLILVAGAAGEEQFAEQFQTSVKRWKNFAEKQQWEVITIGETPIESATDRELLQRAIAAAASAPADRELWLVLIGHGTFAGNAAKFNLVGPDVSAADLSAWLKPIQSPCIVINCASSSGPFVTALAGPRRIIVTATRSGVELNFARFGTYLSEVIDKLTADVDHDREVSLLEAFLAASSLTERYYREDARLTTEHALLEDNGDRVGTGSDFYRGARPIKAAEAGKQLDGRAASRVILFSAPDVPKFTLEQLAERQRIEEQIDALRLRKSQLSEAEYLDLLEPLCLQLAKLYQAARVERQSSAVQTTNPSPREPEKPQQ